MKRILLVEDEAQIQKLVKMNLEIEGYEVIAQDDGHNVLHTLESEHIDLIILDLMLPDIDGIQILEQVRLRYSEIAVLIVSARDASADRVLGLKSGADDYLTKPFNLEELILRVERLIQRTQPNDPTQVESYNFGVNEINFSTYEAKGQNGNFTLTHKEALLLKMLIERKNEVVSRQQILQNVWGYDVYPSTRTIDNFILSFRKYFEEDQKHPTYFISVRGVGYKFVSQENG
ncbi:MAG: response regulator transcription factor [Saprospiraceae bacterium]|nr:response regulator transcription factor [Saprospiraceae bacterium]